MNRASSYINCEWTVLLYIGAVDNGQECVDETMLETLKDITANRFATFSPRVRFAFQLATNKRTRRGTIVDGRLKDTDPGPGIDIATSQPLTDFINWGTSKFPSRYTALFLKDHGTGFEDPESVKELQSASIPRRLVSHAMFYDGKTGRFLPTSDLATAVARSSLGSVDLYGFDACSMAGVEVSYEVRDVARYVMGSESVEASAGWPYRTLLEKLFAADGAILPRDLAIELAALANEDKQFRLSVASTAFLDPLAKSLNTLARMLFRKWSPSAEQALAGVQRLGDPDYVDLGALLQGMKALPKGILPDEVATHAQSALNQLNEACMANERSDKSALSVYYPPGTGSEYLPTYGSLAFGRENAWTLFLGVRFYWLLYTLANRPPEPRPPGTPVPTTTIGAPP